MCATRARACPSVRRLLAYVCRHADFYTGVPAVLVSSESVPYTAGGSETTSHCQPWSGPCSVCTWWTPTRNSETGGSYYPFSTCKPLSHCPPKPWPPWLQLHQWSDLWFLASLGNSPEEVAHTSWVPVCTHLHWKYCGGQGLTRPPTLRLWEERGPRGVKGSGSSRGPCRSRLPRGSSSRWCPQEGCQGAEGSEQRGQPPKALEPRRMQG